MRHPRSEAGTALVRIDARPRRGFCSRCGTMVLFRCTRCPGQLHVALAHFTTLVDRAPQMRAYWENHVPWANVDPDDGLRRSLPEEA